MLASSDRRLGQARQPPRARPLVPARPCDAADRAPSGPRPSRRRSCCRLSARAPNRRAGPPRAGQSRNLGEQPRSRARRDRRVRARRRDARAADRLRLPRPGRGASFGGQPVQLGHRLFVGAAACGPRRAVADDQGAVAVHAGHELVELQGASSRPSVPSSITYPRSRRRCDGPSPAAARRRSASRPVDQVLDLERRQRAADLCRGWSL